MRAMPGSTMEEQLAVCSLFSCWPSWPVLLGLRQATSQLGGADTDPVAAPSAPAALLPSSPLVARSRGDILSIIIREVVRAVLMLTLIEVGGMAPGWSKPWDAPCVHTTR